MERKQFDIGKNCLTICKDGATENKEQFIQLNGTINIAINSVRLMYQRSFIAAQLSF
jgi:hypothetical protein